MTKGKLVDMGVLVEYKGAAITGLFGYRGSGEIDAFYSLVLNGYVVPGGQGGSGFALEEHATAACIEAGKERLDYMLSQRPLADWGW